MNDVTLTSGLVPCDSCRNEKPAAVFGFVRFASNVLICRECLAHALGLFEAPDLRLEIADRLEGYGCPDSYLTNEIDWWMALIKRVQTNHDGGSDEGG